MNDQDALHLLWPGSRDLIAEVFTLGQSLIGDAHPSVALLQARVDANPLCLATATSRSEPNDLLWYSIVYPLLESATSRVLSGEVKSGRAFTTADFASSANISSLYVAMVAAQPTQHVAGLRLFLWHLAWFLRSSESAAVVFARQATEDGGRLLNRFGLEGLAFNSEIQCGITLLPTTRPPRSPLLAWRLRVEGMGRDRTTSL